MLQEQKSISAPQTKKRTLERVRVLVVDDDEQDRKSLTEILRLNGYITSEAATGKEAVEKVRNCKPDVVVLDIRLPDIDGTQVLSVIRSISPTLIIVMTTGFPSVENASKALNMGANSYFVKPYVIEDLLQTIAKKIKQRRETSESQAIELAKLRLRQSQLGEYEEFSERIANSLLSFGLSKTQAKVYVATNVLGSASVSEIADLSGVRREEVYRTVSALRRKGLAEGIRNGHSKFSIVNPDWALTSLTEAKIGEMKKEASELLKKKKEVLSCLSKAAFEFTPEPTIEPIYQMRLMEERLFHAIEQTKASVSVALSADDSGIELLASIMKRVKSLKRAVSVRILLQETEQADVPQNTEQDWSRMSGTAAADSRIQFKHAKSLPLEMVLIDDGQATWGELHSYNSSRVFWTNDSMQLYILQVTFDRLWNIDNSGDWRDLS